MEELIPTKENTKNEITKLNKNILNQKLAQYLSVEDTFTLGVTCKSLFKDMIEEVYVAEGKYKIAKLFRKYVLIHI